MMDWAEACNILGISESATDQEIKEQYIYKAQLLHPDKNQEKPDTIRRKAEAELSLVNRAYDFVLNPNNNPYRIPPRLAIEPSAIRFKDVNVGEQKDTTLTISNVGGPYTSVWIDNQPASWLAVTGVKSITSERLPLEVVLECTGHGEPGKQYTCDLSIKLENEKTRAVDNAAVKIELYTASETSGNGRNKGFDTSTKKFVSGTASQQIEKKKSGFNAGALFLNLLAFAALGAVIFLLISYFLTISEAIFLIGLIIYAAVAVGISVNHAFSFGIKNEKTGNKKR